MRSNQIILINKIHIDSCNGFEHKKSMCLFGVLHVDRVALYLLPFYVILNCETTSIKWALLNVTVQRTRMRTSVHFESGERFNDPS